VAVYAFMTPQMRAELPVEAPWTTTIYPVIATGILLYRARAARIEREMIRAQAQREELERLAKVSLAYRDLTNSPLQTLELLGAELRRQNPDSAKLVDVLERSLTRLRTLGEILSQSEDRVTWTSKEEAFDAAQVIAEFHRSA
jgi:hypothetical protein